VAGSCWGVIKWCRRVPTVFDNASTELRKWLTDAAAADD
jgi:hypothetical protein